MGSFKWGREKWIQEETDEWEGEDTNENDSKWNSEEHKELDFKVIVDIKRQKSDFMVYF